MCGFTYEEEATLGALRNGAAMRYDADPRGMSMAREAVAGYYADHGAEVSLEDVLLTTSTSEGYGYLFRLLCDVGDEVLVPQPSYPLFDYLAELQDVGLRTYPLFYDHGWWIDFARLEERIGPKTRAILVVHPNNPTGHATGSVERERLEELCVRRGLALIVDEVFLDYPLESGKLESFALGGGSVLTFVLSGLSKVAALPQMKVGWMVVQGPAEACRDAKSRLEVIADTFLSMNAPAQLALPAWLQGRGKVQEQIRARLVENLACLKSVGLQVLRTEAGWSAVLRLSGVDLGAAVEMELLREAGVVVHPGRFYGMTEANRVVVSLLVPTGEMERGAAALRGFELARVG